MALVGMGKDERWPDYLLFEAGHTYRDVDVEVPDETLERWRKVIADYEAVQDEMRDVMEAAVEKATA